MLDDAGDDEMDGDEDVYDRQDDDNDNMDIVAASDYNHDMEGGEGHPVPSPASGDPILVLQFLSSPTSFSSSL